ncbi:hypothetical protein LEP1GSC061_3386 [Leptospira wolffii serovar Khorat str. Khorat-H2]|nr:hypothetical protein LEP1GSC061_3386 [Leptospira wolffii serovar Khorat str. Khorat-H2]
MSERGSPLCRDYRERRGDIVRRIAIRAIVILRKEIRFGPGLRSNPNPNSFLD